MKHGTHRHRSDDKMRVERARRLQHDPSLSLLLKTANVHAVSKHNTIRRKKGTPERRISDGFFYHEQQQCFQHGDVSTTLPRPKTLPLWWTRPPLHNTAPGQTATPSPMSAPHPNRQGFVEVLRSYQPTVVDICYEREIASASNNPAIWNAAKNAERKVAGSAMPRSIQTLQYKR